MIIIKSLLLTNKLFLTFNISDIAKSYEGAFKDIAKDISSANIYLDHKLN